MRPVAACIAPAAASGQGWAEAILWTCCDSCQGSSKPEHSREEVQAGHLVSSQAATCSSVAAACNGVAFPGSLGGSAAGVTTPQLR